MAHRIKPYGGSRQRVEMTCTKCHEQLTLNVVVEPNGYMDVTDSAALWMSAHHVSCGVTDADFNIRQAATKQRKTA